MFIKCSSSVNSAVFPISFQFVAEDHDNLEITECGTDKKLFKLTGPSHGYEKYPPTLFVTVYDVSCRTYSCHLSTITSLAALINKQQNSVCMGKCGFKAHKRT